MSLGISVPVILKILIGTRVDLFGYKPHVSIIIYHTCHLKYLCLSDFCWFYLFMANQFLKISSASIYGLQDDFTSGKFNHL